MAGPMTPPPPPPDHLRDPIRHPPSADSLRIGTSVALLAHAGLIAALAFGVAWKREEIATVSAELWAAVPQQAAPAAPPPAPAPRVKAEPVAPPPAPAPAPEPPAPVVKPPPPPPAPAPKVVEPPPPPAPREADIAREKADKRRREAEEAEKLARIEKARQDKAEKAAQDKEREKERAKEREREKAEQKEADKQAALKKEAERKAAEKAAEKAAAKEAEKAAAAEKAKAAAQQEKTAKAREDNLKRLQKQLGEGSDDAAPPTPSRATPGTGSGGGNAAQSSDPSAGYAGRLRAYLKPKLVYTGRNIGSTPAVVRLRVAPDGTILSRELIKSSGQADWDQAVLDAIDRAGVVPRDTDSRVPPVIDIPWTASER